MSEQRNHTPADAPPSPAEPVPVNSPISDIANRLVLWIARHWLAIFNVGWGSYVLLPFLAPILMQMGYTAPARAIYGLYSFTCHQLPDHSYFLFGDTAVPSAEILEAAGAPPAENLLLFRRFEGNINVGYKVALCERDIAIYGSVLSAGLVFGALRRTRRIRPLSLKIYALLLIPIAVDGLTQMFGLRPSNWWLRTVTGAIFGIASVWLAYPYVEDAMQEVVEVESARQTATRSQ